MLRPYERRVRIDFCKRSDLLDGYELAKFQTERRLWRQQQAREQA